jgi:hypothetical protein
MLLLPKQAEHIFIRIPGFKGARIAHLTQWLDQGLDGSISSSYTRLAVRGLCSSQRCYSRIRIRSFWSVTLCCALGQWSVVSGHWSLTCATNTAPSSSRVKSSGTVRHPSHHTFLVDIRCVTFRLLLFLKMNRAMGSLCANFVALCVHTQTQHSCLFRVSYHGPKEEHREILWNLVRNVPVPTADRDRAVGTICRYCSTVFGWEPNWT